MVHRPPFIDQRLRSEQLDDLVLPSVLALAGNAPPGKFNPTRMSGGGGG